MTEAEYVAATEASKEMIWLQRFLDELGKKQELGRLYSDSQSAIHLAKNSAFHSNTKYIQLKYHFIWSTLEDGQLKLEKIHTSQNPADMLTKVVTREKLRICSVSIGLQVWWRRWETARSKVESLSRKWSNGGVAIISLQVRDCWVWSLIIFCIQRFHPDVYPGRLYTPPRWGDLSPPRGSGGLIPPG